GEPIRARPVGSLERLWRWSARNRAVAGLTATVALVLILGIVSSSLFAIWASKSATAAREEEKKAKELDAESRAVLEFFQNKVLAAGRPKGQELGLGTDVTIREALKAAESEVGTSFAGKPRVEAAVRHSLGLTYMYLREPKQAIPHLEKARSL